MVVGGFRGKIGTAVITHTTIDEAGLERRFREAEAELLQVRTRLSTLDHDHRTRTYECTRLADTINSVEKNEMEVLQSNVASVKSSLEEQAARVLEKGTDSEVIGREEARVKRLTEGVSHLFRWI